MEFGGTNRIPKAKFHHTQWQVSDQKQAPIHIALKRAKHLPHIGSLDTVPFTKPATQSTACE